MQEGHSTFVPFCLFTKRFVSEPSLGRTSRHCILAAQLEMCVIQAFIFGCTKPDTTFALAGSFQFVLRFQMSNPDDEVTARDGDGDGR